MGGLLAHLLSERRAWQQCALAACIPHVIRLAWHPVVQWPPVRLRSYADKHAHAMCRSICKPSAGESGARCHAVQVLIP